MKLLDEIVLWPDERLTDTCEEISEITDEIRDIAKRMLQDMYATDGVGLAAPQIGVLKRMVPVTRPSHVVVHAQNLDGDLMQYEAEGDLFAVCLQHEIDHINGITMPDHLGPTARMEVLQRYQEALAAGAKPGETSFDEDE